MSKAELVLQLPVSQAEQQAFEEIYADYYTMVFSIARRVLGSAEEAEEVAQETFMKLYQRWPNPGINTSLKAWLAKVAVNLSFSCYRNQKRRLNLNDKLNNQLVGVSESAESQVIARQDAALVAAALNQLRRKDRACLIARHSGLSYQEVADAAGIRPASVGKVLQRAEAKLRFVYQELEKGMRK